MKRNNFAFCVVAGILFSVTSLSSPVSAIVTQAWVSGLPGPNHGYQEVCGMGTDSLGNVYIAGGFFYHNDPHFVTIKYDPAGVILWQRVFSGQGSSYSLPEDIAVDAAGNVYVTGLCQFPGHSYDVVTIKYDTDGQQIWVTYYNSPNNTSDIPAALALDEQGNVYVTGYTGSNASDYLTLMYNPDGVQQWVTTFNGAGNGSDRGSDIVVDEQGNVYVTGIAEYDSGAFTNIDFTTVKYNPAGVQQWVNHFNGPQNYDVPPCRLTLDSNNNVCITGSSYSDSQIDYITVKYNSSGMQIWQRVYDGQPHNYDAPEGVVVDSQDNVIVTGQSIVSQTSEWQWVTIKYDPFGNQLWLRTYRGDRVESSNLPQALAVDSNDNIYITGISASTGYQMYSDCSVIKYDHDGNLKWIATCDFNNTGDEGDYIAVDTAGDVLVAGGFNYVSQNNICFLTVKYRQRPGDVSATMTPTTTPVQIPAQGGSFGYELLTVNGVTDNLPVDYWWRLMTPTSNDAQFLAGPIQSVLPLDSTSVLRTQHVPRGALAGTYQYILDVGDFPEQIWATDTISVIKLPGEGGNQMEGWDLGADSDYWSESTSSMQPQTSTFNGVSPNPFNPTTTLSFTLPQAAKVSLEVFDIQGRNVGAHGMRSSGGGGSAGARSAPLQEAWFDAGVHTLTFDGSNLPSGIYFARLTAGEYSAVQKMVLLK